LLRFRCLLPLLLNCASLPVSRRSLTSAWPRIDIHDPLNAVALLNRRRNSCCYRTLHRLPPPGMGLPISFESCIPRLAPRSESPISIEPSSSCVAGNVLSKSLRRHARSESGIRSCGASRLCSSKLPLGNFKSMLGHYRLLFSDRNWLLGTIFHSPTETVRYRTTAVGS
jgi:hypothetical protein